ncbi:MAG TPA: hypothetical protein PLR18_04535 [bacterium]|nr:hypothetical protein [bacterium]
MGNVIQGEFGASHRGENITGPDVIKAEYYDLLTGLIKSGAVERLFHLQCSPSTFRDVQNKVRNYTTQQLAEVIEGSSERDWAQNPAFYRAVFNEMKIRLDRELNKK